MELHTTAWYMLAVHTRSARASSRCKPLLDSSRRRIPELHKRFELAGNHKLVDSRTVAVDTPLLPAAGTPHWRSEQADIEFDRWSVAHTESQRGRS